jgi:hypothetical protein
LPAIRAGTAPCVQGFVVAFGALARPVRVSEAKAAAATRMGIVSASIKGRGLKGLPVMWKTKDGKHGSPGQSTLKTLGWRPLNQRCQTLFGVKPKVCRLSESVGTAADAGFVGVRSRAPVARTRSDRSRHGSAPAEPDFDRRWRRRESNPRKISIGGLRRYLVVTGAAEPDVAHPGVDHLRPPGSWPVAQAVAVGA